jgi:sigma-B regulation protein RsbU (phosphoserine phosphatase)
MCGSVGGDFYDFIRANEEQAVILIGDVIGHGVRAALVMARIMGYLHSRPEILTRPHHVITMLNRMLLNLGERVGSALPCSIFYTVIDAPTGTSFFVNGGHPPPFVCDQDKRITLEGDPHNMLLGVEEFDPIEGCHSFAPGQRLVLYTDGILDAQSPERTRFGRERFHEVVTAHAEETPAQCTEAVFAAIDEFRGDLKQLDDETIVVVDRI